MCAPVRFRYRCGCAEDVDDLDHWRQLLRARWYPATTSRPTTAFTFRLLDLFQHLSLQSKANMYDLHKVLNRITDNSGTVRGWVSLLCVAHDGR